MMRLVRVVILLPSIAALRTPDLPKFTRRAALSTASILGTTTQPLLTANAATPIEKGAPAFGTQESRTGLLDGIKSAFSEKSGDDLLAEYERSPADISGVALPPGFANARDAAIIFHGSGGPDRETADVLARFKEQDAKAGLQREVVVYNWMPWFTADTDRLSFQSASVGKSLGRALASNRNLRSLHIIGTSAGSFAADACCSAYVTTADAAAAATAKDGGSGGRAAVRLTLADPFAARDGASFKAGRGAQFFGKDADFAEHYLNTDDIVPNTAVPLPLCYCYDVTAAAERASFPPPDKTGDLVYDLILKSLGGHSWPMGYLARHYETELLGEGGQPKWPSHSELPRGAVVKVA